jgi:SulP family sulfate permease
VSTETSNGVPAEQVRTRAPTAHADQARSIPRSEDVTGASLGGDIAGGIAGSISSLALVLSFGILAFAPLGIEHAGVGVTAGFASAIYGQLIAGFAGGTVHPGSGPRAAATLLLSGLVAALVQDPALAPSATQGPGRIVALAGACVVASGLLQIAFAWLRAGQFARYVPYPFVAGFMCGIAVLVLISQWQPLTGLTPATTRGGIVSIFENLQPATLFVGVVTAAVIGLTVEKARKVPGVLVGLLADCAVYYAIQLVAPGARLGPVVGPVPATLPTPDALLPILALPSEDLLRVLPAIAATAALIAVFGSLDTLFAAVQVDHVTDGRHDTRRELLAHGLANIGSGLCGGVPVVYGAAVSLANWNAGGRTMRSLPIAVAALAGILLAGGRVIAAIPIAVLAGIILATSVGLVDRWVRGLVMRLPQDAERRDLSRVLSLATVVIVATVTVALGFFPALVVGLALSVLLLMVGMNRSLVRSVVDGTMRPSRRVWGGGDAVRVLEARKRVRVVELEGPLFFGSAERLAEEVEPMAGEADVVVLDFRHVTSIDATSALLLERLTRRLARRGTRLVLAGVTVQGEHGRAFAAHSVFVDPSERSWFRDSDKALEWAERRALERAGRSSDAEIPPASLPLLARLTPEEIAIVSSHLIRHEIPHGQVLFREGDPGESLYLIARGAVEISVMTDETRRSRIVTMAAGSTFGELALLDGQPRSATAIAAEPTVLYELTRDALLQELARQHSSIAITMLASLAGQLSHRLRDTTGILRHLDGARG